MPGHGEHRDQAQRRNALRLFVFRILTISIFLVITAVMVEGTYRIYLWRSLDITADAAPTASSNSYVFYAYPPPWKFDLQQGFTFNEGVWLSGLIKDGAFGGCSAALHGNKYGNAFGVWGDYETADVKIILYGSSYTLVGPEPFTLAGPVASGDTSETTANLLAQRLSRQMGKKVVVLNFSRDATGILNLFDVADVTVGKLKPDLLLFTFNTTAYEYQRHWRVVKQDRSGFWRFYQSLEPAETTDPRKTILQGTVISSEVTPQWCATMEAAQKAHQDDTLRNDPVVKDIVRQHEQLAHDMNAPIYGIDFGSLKTSFVYNLLAYGDPYYRMQIFEPRTIYAPLSIDSYRQDEQFVHEVDSVKKTGVPFLLVHLPTLKEFQNGGAAAYGSYSAPAAREQSLAKSLEDLTGHPIIDLGRYYTEAEVKDAAELVRSPQDSHPSGRGISAMADALQRLVTEKFFAARESNKLGHGSSE
jgi:hypothetical protein